MITKEEFFKNVGNMPKQFFSGRQHIMYTILSVVGNLCKGQRESGANFEIDLNGLYRAYLENDRINVSTLRDDEYVTVRWRSPSIAIMMNAGLIDENGYANK